MALLAALLFALLFPAVSHAQRSPLTFRRDKVGRFNLGFMMGVANNRYNTSDQINVTGNGGTVEHIVMKPLPGIALGMISNVNVTDYLSLRCVPNFTFEQRNFDFYFKGNPVPVTKSVESSYFNLPVTAQWRTAYYQRYRIYLLTGAQLGFNMISNKRVRNDPNLIKIQSQDIALVVGTGMILYGERIKLSPELRYAAGIKNLYIPEYTNYSSTITSLFSQTITLCINFE